MFQGLDPDIALVQELNYKTNSEDDIQAFVATAFGPEFHLFRESDKPIPNGIVSRWPILASGAWTDPYVVDRSFAYAKIDVPGPRPLWAVSVHLLTSGATARGRGPGTSILA